MSRDFSHRVLLWLGVILLSVLTLAACKPTVQFNNVDLTGANYARDFNLVDGEGQRRRLADFRGKLVIVFFGFTQCPDVCPTTLSELVQIKKQLGADGERVQVVFISVDPERDTPAVIKQYVPNFDPSFIGLTGSSEEIAATAREFKVFYAKVPGKTPTSYTIDHTAGSYVYDTQGRLRLFLRQGQGAELIAADLKQLLKQ